MTRNDAAGEPERSGLILATVCLCQLMVVLDVSVVNVALPSIGHALGFSSSSLSWVVNAYTLVFGGLLLLGGRLADLVGPRRAVLSGLVLFAIASVLGGLSRAPGELVAARAGQGLAGAVLAPVSLTIIMVTFPEGRARARALGIWAMVAGSGSAIGVLAGGVLTDALGWRWVLFINVPIVAIAVLMAAAGVQDGGHISRRRLDVGGSVLGTAAMASLVFSMVEAGERGWGSPLVVGVLVLSIVCAGLFFWWEQAIAVEPLVRFGTVKTRSVWIATVVVAFIGAATIAGFYFASLFLQNVLGYTPLRAGAAFLPFCVGVMAGAFASARLAAGLGSRMVISGGLFVGAAGMILFARLGPDSAFVSGFVLPSVLASVGIGACMVATMSLGTSGVARSEAGMVSGLLNASRQCGGSIGLAALSAIAVSASHSGASADTAAAILVRGYDRAFLVCGLCIAVAGVAAAVFVPSRAMATSAGESISGSQSGH